MISLVWSSLRDIRFANPYSEANGKMRACRGMRACSLGLVGFGFRVRNNVRVSVSNRVGVRAVSYTHLTLPTILRV